MSGTSATINIPAVATATYLKNNQLNTWKGNTASGDADGNLTADKVGHSYTWDERNHLSIVTTSSSAVEMHYDALGRRWERCTGLCSPTTLFLFDGLNPVQEQVSNNANLLTGLALDEYFTRSDSSGTMNFLRDGLGSTIALTNSSGGNVTQYSYEPFGSPTATGTTNSNPYQFTGRQYDAAAVGLYYMRARYYSTRLQRFISQDPLGFGAGDANLYRYVGNDPVDFTDQQGTCNAAGFFWGVAAGVAGAVSTPGASWERLILSGLAGGAIGGVVGCVDPFLSEWAGANLTPLFADAVVYAERGLFATATNAVGQRIAGAPSVNWWAAAGNGLVGPLGAEAEVELGPLGEVVKEGVLPPGIGQAAAGTLGSAFGNILDKDISGVQQYAQQLVASVSSFFALQEFALDLQDLLVWPELRIPPSLPPGL